MTTAPKTLEFKEVKILEGTVPWAQEKIIEHLKTRTLPTTYDDLFQMWQAASCLDELELADQCSKEMEKLLISLDKNGIQMRPRRVRRVDDPEPPNHPKPGSGTPPDQANASIHVHQQTGSGPS